MRRRRATILAAACFLALAVFPAGASATGGRYAFDGGTQAERAQVRAALQASSFDWNVIPARVTVHIQRSAGSVASPGQIWLDASLLDAGPYSWAVVQHEFAHQVDWLVLTDADRAALQALLGGSTWCSGGETVTHDDNTCERFATSVAWAYWPSTQNAFAPAGTETWLRPGALKALLGRILSVRR